MANFKSFSGTITMIEDFSTGSEIPDECYKLMTVQNEDENIVNFVITPDTYFVNHVTVKIGDKVIGFYDANVPVPLIYPPQYQAIVMAKAVPFQNVKVDYFDEQLVSSDGTLRLNLSPYTQILLENDQLFTGNPANHNLIVVYGATTNDLPVETASLYKIIVMC